MCHGLKDDINVICELLAVNLALSLFSNSVLDTFIEFLCTTQCFLLSYYVNRFDLCVLCTIFIINI